MTTVAAEIGALFSSARRAAGLIKAVESSEALQAKFADSVEQVSRETGQVAYAVSKALVAHALGRDPADDEVNEFLSAAVGDPAFPARAHRLMGEARKTASHRRRAFLASILFGLPFSKVPDDERDRIDMVVERMTVEDAELLMAVDRLRDALPQNLQQDYGPFGIVVRVHADLQSPRPLAQLVTVNVERTGESPSHQVRRDALEALITMGCLERGRELAKRDGHAGYHLLITQLGESLLRAFNEVRAGATVAEP